MRVRSFVALAGALAMLGAAASASAQRGGWEVAGDWTAQGETGMGTCKVTLTEREWFGGWQASSFGCSGRLFGLGKYRIEGSELVLLGMGDREAGRLRMRGGVLTGMDADGKPLILSRAGAPPRLPSGGAVAAPRGGGWSGDRDCVRYGDSDRCATRREQAPPQLRLLTLANIRDRPSFDGAVVGTAPKGTCAAVRECVTERGATWCRIQWEGAGGYVVQVAPPAGERRSATLVFTAGCDQGG